MTGADPLEDLAERIVEVGESAQEEYDEDAVASILGHLGDAERDVADGADGEEFMAGFRYAKHLVAGSYLTYSGEYDCDCPGGRPLAEETMDVWRCAQCGTHLAYREEVPGYTELGH